MYFNILKRDLKRKKTMNIILLLFAILASMFVSSGLNNVVSVMNGTDYYLDIAGVGDYMVITQNSFSNVEDILKESSKVISYKKEDCYWGTKEEIRINGANVSLKRNTILFHKIFENGIKFYDDDNAELKKVNVGETYVTAGFLEDNELSVGDCVEIDYHGIKKTYTIAGEIKDAFLGSDMMGNTRFIISDEDYDEYENSNSEELAYYKGSLFYVNTNDIKSVSVELSDAEGIIFTGDRSMIKLTYVMEMIIAMIVLVLSICLCIVSFVLLKFVISFTINEEYREIGVMKAIGIRNFKIRSIYMTKYCAMAFVGGILGFFFGIPFGRILIDSISKKMVLSNDYGIMINIIGTVIVILIMSGFAYLCTSKVKKLTPVDAIRNGSTGETYGKKSFFSLKKSKFGNAFSMALNDLLSSPKRFLTIIITFFICSVFVFGLVEVADTMKSDSLITTFGKKSDVYINSDKFIGIELLSESGNIELPKKVKSTEDDLKELNMPGKVNCEIWYKYKVSFDNRDFSLCCQQNKYAKTFDYEYTEGSAPLNSGEIAITKQIAEMIGAKIGDTVTIDFVSEKKECIVTGYFQTMNQLGSVIRLHESAPTAMEYASSIMAFQIDFDDAPDNETVNNRIEKLKTFYETEDICNASDYCIESTGVAETMDMVRLLLLIITGIVVILVTLLIESSMISDEKSQIALLKAIGFKDRFIIRWQVIRIMIVGSLAEILAILLTHPVTELWCNPIWRMMGAYNVKYYFNPVSLLLIYPGIILAITYIAARLTAGFTKKITCNDVGNVE